MQEATHKLKHSINKLKHDKNECAAKNTCLS